MNNSILYLIQLLGLSDDDILRALLSVYSPCQPGALRKSWSNRKDYGNPPTAKEMWEIYEKYDFRCVTCGSQYRISFDHINNNTFDNRPKNLQVLCQTCNRAKQPRGVKHRDAQLKLFKTFCNSSKINDDLLTSNQLHKDANIGKTGGASMYLAKFLLYRYKQLKSRNKIK